MSELPYGIGEWKYLIVDANDNRRLAHFWSHVLGTPIKDESPPYIDLVPVVGQPRMSFQQVDEPKRVKNRVHPDIKVADLEVAREQIVLLGGSVVRKCVEPPYQWYIMADPEDNEFCIVEN